MTVTGQPSTLRDDSAGLSSGRQLPGRWALLARWFVRHPLLSVALVAGLARLTAVILLGPLRPGVAVPDEAQYLGLAESVASGRGAEAWQPGYGQSLYDATATFMRPLAALTWAFGPHQLSGQLLAALFGVVTAVLTTVLALKLVRPRFALAAGLIVALMPSQVFWSSVVLRESMVWASLVLLALAVTMAARCTSRRGLLLPGVLGFATLYALCDLREQTAVVAAWSIVLAALVVRGRHPVLLGAGALAIALAAPAFTGLGPAGINLVESAVPRLAVIRANLSLGASSSIVKTTPLAPTPPVPSAASSHGPPGGPTAAPSPPPGTTVVGTASGQKFLVDNTSPASLSALPGGLLAVTVRPYPWEATPNAQVLLAKVENVGWAALYLLAIIGASTSWRLRQITAFPIISTGAVLVVAAVTQGNLGTAFRHRGQVLWALALLAALGLQQLVDRRRRRATA